jgi:hypothetical protein
MREDIVDKALLEELAAKIESGTKEDSYKLLMEAWQVVNGDRTSALALTLERLDDWYYDQRSFSRLLEAGGDLSAAMMLVPEGWFTRMATEDRHSHSWRWELRKPPADARARAATPALALCSAALRARALSQKDAGE